MATPAEQLQTQLKNIEKRTGKTLKQLHDAFMKKLAKLGEFETVPKKTYLSLRRKKQFAMVRPATNSRVDVGLNMKGAEVTGRLESEKPGGMCTHKVVI